MKPLAQAAAAAALLLFVSGAARTQPAVTELQARDNPGDGGSTIQLTWQPIDSPGLVGYQIMRQAEADTWERVAFRGPMASRYSDPEAVDGVRYQYRLDAVYPDTTAASPVSAWVSSSAQWFNPDTILAVISTIVFTLLIVYPTYRARRGKDLFIRRIAGLDAVEEALGRATEMGRPVLFVPGLSYIDDVATIAAINILSEIAKETAKFGTPLVVPIADPIVYTVARETVKESYTTAGRPDAFDPGSVFFVSNQQFAYAAAVDGIMTREKPATNFFIGMFWAESLILAETGATTGAVQIAGTDAVSQLPFFITACDYTLIGEELYAASAYISREPLLMGALKGQDYSKFIIVSLIVLGTLLALVFSLDTPSWL